MATTQSESTLLPAISEFPMAIFMPAAMLFLLMLLNDRDIMGSYINRPWQNWSAFAIVGFLILANGLYGYTVVFPSV